MCIRDRFGSAGDPHPVKLDELVTVAPLECVVAVDPLAPLPIPVNLFPVIPVYDISSVPIVTWFVPVEGKPVVLVNVISVEELLLPPVVPVIAPSKVVVIAPSMLPPHNAIPQPKAPICSAGPT